MKKISMLAIAVFSFYLGTAQTVQWASKVVAFSSQLTSVQYSAEQALGRPDVLPTGGDHPGAWTPDRKNKVEYITVGFEQPMKIKQIAIAESFNPSALIGIYLYDPRGNEFKISEFTAKQIPLNGRMVNIFYETDYEVSAIKLTFDGGSIDGYFSIDAIGISDSETPVEATVETPEYLTNNVTIEDLGKNVNSEYKEYKPVLSPDGQTMYFSRKNHPENMGGVDDPEDIWISSLGKDGQWELAKNAGPQLNNNGPNFVSSATPDGNSVLLLLGNKYLDKGKMQSGVSISSNRNGTWSEPYPLAIDNEYNYSEKANYYLANSRLTLLMSIEREDSEGDRDLYVSFMREDSTWTEPLNLGDVVNSAGTEAAPFLAVDDETLYFASNGFSGYGGMDIYVTKRLDDSWTQWSEPQNLGPQINSPYEDVFFNIPASSDYAYYSRGVSEENTDIYRIEMPLFQRPDPVILVKGKLFNSATGEPVAGVIRYERLSDGKEMGIIESHPETGEYEIYLPLGELYGIRAEAEGFIPESQNIDLRNAEGNTYQVSELNLKLVPVEVEQVIVLNNIFFAFDKWNLLSESYPELDRLIEYMRKNSKLKIEISGHTDWTGPASYNMVLSKRRAQSVADYLTKNGADSERVKVTWFGEANPVESNETLEGRKKNRRVEFKILEK